MGGKQSRVETSDVQTELHADGEQDEREQPEDEKTIENTTSVLRAKPCANLASNRVRLDGYRRFSRTLVSYTMYRTWFDAQSTGEQHISEHVISQKTPI